MIQLYEHFTRDERYRHSEWLRQQRWLIKARQDQVRREEAAEQLEEDLAYLVSEVVMASSFEIAEFEAKLDRYDAATVKALMENQEKLDAVNLRIEMLLSQAYVMEDGRRVFKTADGTQVFDEFAQEVSPQELDFNLISSNRPSWERVKPEFQERDRLEAEQQQLLEYQEKLDEAREQIADGEISVEELEELDAELEETMPLSVQQQIPDFETAGNAPDLKAAFKSSDNPLFESQKQGAASAPEFDPVN